MRRTVVAPSGGCQARCPTPLRKRRAKHCCGDQVRRALAHALRMTTSTADAPPFSCTNDFVMLLEETLRRLEKSTLPQRLQRYLRAALCDAHDAHRSEDPRLGVASLLLAGQSIAVSICSQTQTHCLVECAQWLKEGEIVQLQRVTESHTSVTSCRVSQCRPGQRAIDVGTPRYYLTLDCLY